LGSDSSEQMESNTLLSVSAGDQLSFKMSKQMLPFPLMLGWYTLEIKFTLGGLKG